MPKYEQWQNSHEIHRPRSLSFPPHLHQHLELVRVDEGALELDIQGERHMAAQGGLAVIFPGVVHAFPGGENSLTLFLLDAALVPEFAKELHTMQPHYPTLSAGALAAPLMDIEALTAPADTRLLKGHMLVLLSHISELCGLIPRSGGQEASLLYRALAYISQHYTEDISLDSVAAALGVSRYKVSRCITGGTGESFTGYVNALRAQSAAALLRGTGLPITQIGYEVGFGSLGSFYRAFGARYGVPPSSYREG